MEPGYEKGQQPVTQSVFDQASDSIADTVHRTTRAASAAVDAIENGVTAAGRAVKHGSCVAEGLYDDAKHRIQKNPAGAVIATFAIGMALGTGITWMLRRMQHCGCDAHQQAK